MPAIFSHAAVGAAVAKLLPGDKVESRRTAIACALLAVVPDFDGLLFGRIPYGHLFGHRGITHSLLFAAMCGVITTWFFARHGWVKRGAVWRYVSLFAAVTASPGVLDAFTSGGLGVAFFAPFDSTRYFSPHRPIPVSPMPLRALFSARGARVAIGELILLWTLAGSVWLWESRRTAWRRALAIILALIGLWAWHR